MLVLNMGLLLPVMVLAHVCLYTLGHCTPVVHEMLVFIEHVSL